MSDFELVSGPSSPRSNCSSASSHSSSADRSAASSTAAVHPIAWAENARPLSQECSQQGHPTAIREHQQRGMAFNKPRLSMRPISTPVNLLVCGASGSGKSSFISAFIRAHEPAPFPGLGKEADACAESWRVSGTGSAADPHAVLLAGPDQFAAVVGSMLVPEAGRELLYKLQDCPAHGATIDPAGYLEALLTFLLQQQKKDFDQLHGSSSAAACRGMPKSQVCGSLSHSITACLYFLPPSGPSKLDLVLMAGLSRHVALLPVVGRADNLTPAEAERCCKAVQHMLAAPGEYGAGLETIKTYGPDKSRSPFLLDTRGPEAATGGDPARLCRLLALLTGDEVYGLLDHAWDMYTGFCSAHGDGSKSVAALVAEACAAATRPHFPGLKTAEEVKLELAVVKMKSAVVEKQREEVKVELGMVKKQMPVVEKQREEAKVELAVVKEKLAVVEKQRKELKDITAFSTVYLVGLLLLVLVVVAFAGEDLRARMQVKIWDAPCCAGGLLFLTALVGVLCMALVGAALSI